jgi:hypothetical protein
MKLKKLLPYTFILLLAVCFTACSDNSSGPEGGEEAPEIPDITAQAQPDISFFQNTNPTAASIKRYTNFTVENFNTAKGFVLGGAGFLSISQLYAGFINPAQQGEANFINGQFVWEYNFSPGGQSVSIRTTARPQGNGFKWATFISGDDGEGNVLSDFKIMEGTTSNDGAQGDWTFFTFGDEDNSTIFLTSSWNVISETESTIDLQVFGDGEEEGTISYQENGAENLMSIDFSDEEGQVEVLWNTDTSVGYFMQGTERNCWDGSFQNISCAEVGL